MIVFTEHFQKIFFDLVTKTENIAEIAEKATLILSVIKNCLNVTKVENSVRFFDLWIAIHHLAILNPNKAFENLQEEFAVLSPCLLKEKSIEPGYISSVIFNDKSCSKVSSFA